MATLHEIKQRISSVKNTQKITRAMKMVAAAKLKRAQQSITLARPYAHKMRDLVNNLAMRADGESTPLLAKHAETGRIGLIVIASDRGLCGAFNSSIGNAAKSHLQTTFEDKEVEMTLVGKRAVEMLRKQADTVKATHTDTHDSELHRVSNEIVDSVVAAYVNGEIEEVYCLYNEFKSAINQNVTLERVLPFEAPEPTEGESTTDYLYEPSEDDVFEALLDRHLKIQMHRMLAESAASEHGARMTAMDSATTNAGEMIDRLTLEYNRARQSAITTELIEVVSGAEAL